MLKNNNPLEKKYPILEFDSERNAIIEPKRVVKPAAVPECCVISFFNDEIHKLHQKGVVRKVKKLKSEIGAHLVFVFEVHGQEIALFHPGVGAPLAAGLLEEVIALGCKKFIACGGAGVLDSELPVGKMLVPVSAVRDEGTSYHYLPPAREIGASPQAVEAIELTLKKHKIKYLLTKTWTTDAIYRETTNKIARRRAEGCLAVEMEAAALFAVAQFRGVTIGQILYAGDDVSGKNWDSRDWVKHATLRGKLIWVAAEACLAIE